MYQHAIFRVYVNLPEGNMYSISSAVNSVALVPVGPSLAHFPCRQVTIRRHGRHCTCPPSTKWGGSAIANRISYMVNIGILKMIKHD